MYKCVGFTFAQPNIFYMKACDSRYSQCLYFASSALSRKVEKLASQCWAPVGLSPSHGYLLMIAIEEPGVQPSFLVEQLQLTPSTITRLIEKLDEKQLGGGPRNQFLLFRTDALNFLFEFFSVSSK